MAEKFYFTGKLILANDLNKINYGVYNKNLTTFDSITNILDSIHKSNNPLVRIVVKQLDNGHVKNHMGDLYVDKDKYGIDGYFINSLPFDLYLDEIVGENVEIFIEEFENDMEDGTRHDNNIKIS